MNKRRLDTLIKFMDRLPRPFWDKFNMGFWYADGSSGHPPHALPYLKEGKAIPPHLITHACGTSACALGWATTIPSFRKAGLKLHPTGLGTSGSVFLREWEGTEAAAQFFAIPQRLSDELFYAQSCRTPKEWVEFAKRKVKAHERLERTLAKHSL